MTADVQILEYASGKPSRVDRATSTIHGVKLLGDRSANPPPNDNDYPRGTRETAIKLIEGSFSFLGHAPGKSAGQRPYGEKIGRHVNVREAGDGLFSDFRLNPKHPLAEAILWDAENDPNGIAFSISGQGRKKRVGGRNIVEEITSIQSVDLVVQGGTVKGLFENREGGDVTTTIKGLLESLKADAPRHAALKEMADAAGLPETAEAPAPGGGSPEEQLLAGFEAAIVAVVRDRSMDFGAKKAKIGELLKMLDKAQGGGKTEPPGKPDKPEGKTQEGLQMATDDPAVKAIQEELRQLRAKEKARSVCAGLQIAAPPEALVEAMAALGDEPRMKALAELHRPGQARGAAPAKSQAGGATPLQESKDRPPQNAKEAARRWTSK